MKRTLSALTLALLTLTACGTSDNSEAAPEATAADAPPTAEPTQPAPERSRELQPDPDGYNMRVLYQWVPQDPSIKPVDTRVTLTVMDEEQETVESYVSPIGSREEVPSMDADQYFTKDFHVPFDGIFSAQASVSDPPNRGRLTCIIVELDQQVVLDYQETDIGAEDSLTCYGFTHDDHDYVHGEAPVDVEFN